MPISFKCPGCGAYISDDPDSSVLTCSHCGITVTKYIQQTKNVNVNVKKHSIVEHIQRDVPAEKEAKKETVKSISRMITIVLCILLVLSPLFLVRSCVRTLRQSDEAQNQKLEALALEIENDILSGDYDAALLKTTRLRWEGSTKDFGYNHWEQQRNELIERIEEYRQQ